MIIDARTLSAAERVETDICIVGAGAAGIALAHEFIGKSQKVVLLESGGFDFDADTQSLYAGDNTGLQYFPLNGARLRYFGGTTNHWGGYCQPLGDIDFEQRDWIPHSGWPVNRADLAAYYARAQDLLGLDPDGWETDFWTAQDRFPAWALNDERIITRVAQISPEPIRRFGKHYRDAVTTAVNIDTYLHANVTQIVTNESGQQVDHVEVTTLEGNQFVVAAKQFVLAAGGLENPRLLLLSDRQQTNGLGNEHDLVGRFFMEHPRFDAATIIPTNPNLPVGFYSLHKVNGKSIKGYLSLSQAAQREEELVDVQVRMKPVYSEAYASAFDSADVVSLRAIMKMFQGKRSFDDFGRHFRNVVADLGSFQSLFAPSAPFPVVNPFAVSKLRQIEEIDQLLVDYLGDVAIFGFEELFNWIPVEHIEVLTRIDQAPNPNSRITLTDERDRLGQRKAKLHWELTELDKRSVLRTLELIGNELGRSGLGRLRIDLEDDLTTWPDGVRGGYHHMGTTRMNDDPTQGVVDGNCQVHGIGNLYIAGSSVFPTGGLGTPTLTLLALTLRLADRLQEVVT
ncbi:MAG: FAD-dependent oxidoreductase [Chloroflexota bacterium]